MGEERRNHRRIPVELAAELSGDAGRTLACTILDYSLGGLSLEIGNPDDALHVVPGATFVVTFFGPGEQNSSNTELNRLRIRVRRRGETFAGVGFESKLSHRARAVLESAAAIYRNEHQPADVSTALPPKVAKEFVQSLSLLADEHLTPLFGTFLQSLPDLLLGMAESARNNTLRGQLYETLGTLSSRTPDIISGYSNQVKSSLALLGKRKLPHFGRPETDQESAGLSLVDEDEFEDWLAVRVTAQRGEGYHQDLLELLNEGISLGLGLPLNNRNNPLAPALLTQAYHTELGDLCRNEALLKIFLTEFTRQVIHELDGLYEAIRQLLQSRGLLDRAEEARLEARRAAVRAREEEEPAAKTTEAPRTSPQAETSQSGPAASGTRTPANLPPPSPHPAGGLSTLQNLLSTSRSASSKYAATNRAASPPMTPGGTGGGTGGGAGDSGVSGGAGNTFGAGATGTETQISVDATQLDSLLRQMQQESGNTPAKGRLSDMLSQAMATGEAGSAPQRLGVEQQKSVDMVENLIDGLQEEPGKEGEVSAWLQQLQVPMLRLLMKDQSFVQDPAHPARQVINQIVRLAGNQSQKSTGLDKTIQHFVNRISQEYDQDNGVFEESLSELNKIVERRNQSFLRNLERIRTSQEGHQRLLDARNLAAKKLRRITWGQPVSGAVKSLIEEGWRDLMVTTIVRDGSETPGFLLQCKILEQMIALVPPVGTEPTLPQLSAAEADELLLQIQTGLELASADAYSAQSIHDDLALALRGERAKIAEQRLLPEALSTNILKIEKSELSSAPQEQFPLPDRHRLRKLRAMQPGDGILQNPGTPDMSRIRLAWKADDNSRMVFVDDRGLNPRELALDALIDQLHQGKAEIQLDGDLPPIDKSILKTIQGTYSQLVEETARDPLTGAYTRREFMRKLDGAVQQARSQAKDRILFYLDIDRFKVINSDAGQDAGDALVARIAKLCGELLPKLEHTGRMGGDELGLLLANCTTEQAIEAAEKLRAGVEAIRFEWNDKVFQPTVSIGIVEIHHGMEDVNALMRIADSACFAAKSSGRNRAHLFVSTDMLSSRQTAMMSWVSRINRCLEENRLELRLQHIAPISGDDTHHHFEVLLAVVDEDGQPGSPFEFIQAAEAYGRIQAVDRWVVTTMLGWLRDHPERLEDVGGVAINLSGASVGDERFLEFLLGEIHACGVDPARLGFEVTETVTVSSLEAASEFIAEVRAAGCPFALDDFGSGMSSFAYLRTMPVDYLKIDGVFVKDIATNTSDYAMVKSINEIGHFLGKKTIAEYVENDEILEKLREIGVDYAQGWSVSKPIPLHTF